MTTSDQGTKSKTFRVLYRLWNILAEPHPDIHGVGRRQKARLLSVLLLFASPILVYAQLVTDLVEPGFPVYLSVSFLAGISYIVSRTRYYNLAVTLPIIGVTALPLAIFLWGSNWDLDRFPRLLVWVFIALLIGSLFLKPRIVIVQAGTMLGLIIYISFTLYNLNFNDISEYIGTSLIVIVLVVLGAMMMADYVKQLTHRTSELDKERWELEVYSQLLRHDLRNDMQALLYSVELSLLTCAIDTDIACGHMETSMAIGNRIIGLLDAFSISANGYESDVLSMIELLAGQAESFHPEMKITVLATEEARNTQVTPSRLMPTVWANIFRNAAQHAGPSPSVEIHADIDIGELVILISDNGPGVPDSEREWLFRRGKGTESTESGLGLYLARIILESQGGKIALKEDSPKSGCTIEVRLPIELIST
ncbi:MAG: sensor histidine kinase [Candidatus Thorarchaeota archaeon]